MEPFAKTRTESIADRISGRILDGTYPPGSKLPSVRRIALDEGCSTSTAVAAFESLVTRGLATSVERSGHFVRSRSGVAGSRFRASTSNLDVVRSRTHGLVRRILEMGQDPSITPFHGAVPHPSLLPLSSLGRHLSSSLAAGSSALGSYTPAGGSLRLRRELSKFLAGRGIDAPPESIVATNGCMEALALAVECGTDTDAVVAIESPTFFGLVSLLEDLGRKIVEIPVDPSSGMRLDLLESAMETHAIQAIVVSPDVQNPTGARMDLESRGKLVRLARRHDATIVEDSVFSASLFDGDAPAPLASIWPEGTMHCSSASKVVAPGLRLGWLVPGRHLERVLRTKSGRSLGGPVALQDSFAGFLESSSWPRHLRRFRHAVRSQVRSMREAVVEHFPAGTRISDPQGGYFLWIQVPGLDCLELFERALQEGIGIIPGPVFSAHRGRFRDCFRLSCGTPATPEILGALERLGRLVGSLRS